MVNNMTQEPIKQVTVGDQVLTVEYDIDPIDPRSNDNLGKMAFFHNRYGLPNESGISKDSFSSWEELEAILKNDHEAMVMFPVCLYDHGSISVKIGERGDMWDSGKIGYIYASKEAILNNFTPYNKPQKKKITKSMIEQTKKVLEAEMKEFDLYIQGLVMSYFIQDVKKCNLGHEHRETVESCTGFYSMEDIIATVPEKFKAALCS